MSNGPQNGEPKPGSGAAPRPRMPFPATRALYTVGFAVAAWCVFWVVLVFAIVQFVVIAVDGKVNSEVKDISARLVRYLVELLSFIVFMRDERPFPFGPFPQANQAPAGC